MSGASLAVSLDLLGVGVRVEVGDPAAAIYVRDLIDGLPPARRQPERTVRLSPNDHGPGRNLYDGDALVQLDMSGPAAIRTLLWYLNQVALETAHYAVLHAGAVSQDRRAVILPARMDAGKSTLVAALVDQGFDYLSDEFAPIHLADGTLVPYRGPLGLDPGSFPLFPHLKPQLAEEFEDLSHWHVLVDPKAQVGSAPMVPHAVVFPSYRQGAPCSLTRLAPTEAVHLAADQALNLFDLGRPAFHALSELVRAAPAYELVFGELADACAAVGDVVRGEPS